mmetsp:Transcript_44082/g.101751  ORF Transcript_44082/g.101751 Transcript_44082/m.101751 type:complete len:208 (-) Transcript_44082:4567-5190(-)
MAFCSPHAWNSEMPPAIVGVGIAREPSISSLSAQATRTNRSSPSCSTIAQPSCTAGLRANSQTGASCSLGLAATLRPLSRGRTWPKWEVVAAHLQLVVVSVGLHSPHSLHSPARSSGQTLLGLETVPALPQSQGWVLHDLRQLSKRRSFLTRSHQPPPNCVEELAGSSRSCSPSRCHPTQTSQLCSSLDSESSRWLSSLIHQTSSIC